MKLNSHGLEFLCLYSLHLNRAFLILAFYHILNTSEIPLMGYNKLEHDNIIPNKLQDSTFNGVQMYMVVTLIF